MKLSTILLGTTAIVGAISTVSADCHQPLKDILSGRTLPFDYNYWMRCDPGFNGVNEDTSQDDHITFFTYREGNSLRYNFIASASYGTEDYGEYGVVAFGPGNWNDFFGSRQTVSAERTTISCRDCQFTNNQGGSLGVLTKRVNRCVSNGVGYQPTFYYNCKRDQFYIGGFDLGNGNFASVWKEADCAKDFTRQSAVDCPISIPGKRALDVVEEEEVNSQGLILPLKDVPAEVADKVKKAFRQ